MAGAAEHPDLGQPLALRLQGTYHQVGHGGQASHQAGQAYHAAMKPRLLLLLLKSKLQPILRLFILLLLLFCCSCLSRNSSRLLLYAAFDNL